MTAVLDVSKPVPARFECDGIILRPLAEFDLPLTLSWRNRDGVRQCFLNSSVITPEAHQAWFEQYKVKTDDIVLVAFERGQSQPCGQVAIYGIDNAIGRAEVGRFIAAPEAQGRGIMRRAISALLILAHDQLRLRTVFLEVFANNSRAIALYSSLGFVETARRGELIEMNLSLEFYVSTIKSRAEAV